MTATQKVTTKLWSINQWLIPMFVASMLSLMTWGIVQIFELKERTSKLELSEASEDHTANGDLKAIRAEMNERVNVADENRKRIENLETARTTDFMTFSVGLAKIQTSLEDIRERVIRLDAQHQKKPDP